MSATKLASRFDRPEIYANTDISSPGHVIEEAIPEPTGVGPGWEELLPAWEQGAIARRREQNISRLPVAFLMARTGTNAPVAFATVLCRVQKATIAEDVGPTLPVPRLIAQIRSSLSLQIKQLAEVLNVERPTIYAWIKEQSVPRAQSRRRLRELYLLAKRWDELAPEPLGKALTEIGSDGRSVLDSLLQSDIPHTFILDRFRAIVRDRAHAQAAKPRHKKSLSQLAEEHGIDMSRIKPQDAQLDVLTGKRVALD